MAELDFLDSKHPVFETWVNGVPIAAKSFGFAGDRDASGDRPVTFAEQVAYAQLALGGNTYGAWLRNEIRLRGGDEVLAELRRFDWEIVGGEHYRARQAQASYINFPDLFVAIMIGHLLKVAPVPGKAFTFGQLGSVSETERALVTQADMVYYNVDGVGNDGSQWHNFWAGALRRAFATGHRWIMVEATRRRPQNVAEERQGLRPYLVEWSPTRVPNWNYDEGRLDFVITRPSRRRLRIGENGSLEGNKPEDGYLLMVRQGFDGLGSKYSGGGWWEFTRDKTQITGAEGRWDATGGEIPMFPLFYERDTGSDLRPAMSRPGMSELGQLAVSYMNLGSAADFDAWDAATSMQFFLGVDAEAFNLAMAKIDDGSRWVPVPSNQTTQESPTVHDGSMGAVTAEVFASRMTAKRTEAAEIAEHEVTSTPDSSGESKKAGFAEGKSPRLALLADNLEQAQNTAIRFLEMRFGHKNPTGYVVWPRDFDLVPLLEEIDEMVNLETLSGYRSPTLGAHMMTRAAQERGLIVDEPMRVAVESEYKDAAQSAADNAAAGADLFGSLVPKKPKDAPAPDPNKPAPPPPA